MGRLEDKTAIITGAAGGLGAAYARRFLDEGANVVIADISDAGQETAAELGKSHPQKAVFCQADITDSVSCDRVATVAVDPFRGRPAPVGSLRPRWPGGGQVDAVGRLAAVLDREQGGPVTPDQDRLRGGVERDPVAGGGEEVPVEDDRRGTTVEDLRAELRHGAHLVGCTSDAATRRSRRTGSGRLLGRRPGGGVDEVF
ncbi:MAG TPA: SDR family NAD(P)-dependent oxidoreductase, partial [Acidimicrobiales bacterium]|nr:SDR family NAD(P)-dependent oxidoreductase [Acidimicrobiales bacterium]